MVDYCIVQSVALRGREGGATAEMGGEAAYALRAANGGGSDPYVLAPTIAFSCKDYGADCVEDIAPTMRAMGHSGSHANAGGQLAVCVTEPVTHTLKAEGFDASEDGTGRGQPIVACETGQGWWKQDSIAGTLRCEGENRPSRPSHVIATPTTMAVRRLMPNECHRLQGFPDDWCAVPIGPAGKIASDGPQYKQLGNSWAVNHSRWVGHRIADWLAENPKTVIEMQFDEDLLVWMIAA